MSELTELLEGVEVEWKALWEVTIWDKRFNAVDRDKQPKVENYQYLLAANLFNLEHKNGDVFLLSTGKRTGWTTKELAGTYLREGEVVTIPWGKSRPVIDVLKYYKGLFVTADNRIATSNNTDILLNKFLFYWLQTQSKVIDGFYRGSGIQHPNMAAVLDMSMPIPPISVQKEIVRILDTFSERTDTLGNELITELEARKKHYNYYRDRLLSFEESKVEWKILGEVTTIGTGSRNTNESIVNGEYPFFVRSQEPRAINEYEFDETAIITAGDGVGVGKVFHYVIGKYALHQRAYRIVANDNSINLKYLFHYMKNNFAKYLEMTSVHASVTSLRKPMFEKYPVPIPSPEEQERIVAILDKLDSLTSAISEALPKEIALRKKQYEYYRHLLLTFPNDNINE